MKNLFTKSLLVVAFAIPTILSAGQLKGLNVIINSGEPQTQMMAMVLSTMAVKKHKKIVNITLCGAAGDLAVKGMKSEILKPMNKSPKMMMKAIMKKGAKVEVCPLYLPNAGKDASVLIKGITVAKPPKVAAQLLNDDFTTLSY